MKTKHFLPLLLLAACTENTRIETSPSPLFPQPKTFTVKTGKGYTLNTITQDTIQPIILRNADTLITGIPIPAQEKIIHPDSVNSPKIVVLIDPDSIYNTQPNVHKIPDELTIIPVNKNFTTKIIKNASFHYLINSTGDTIRTGIAIRTIGKEVFTKQPKPTKALSPRVKDSAINDIQYLDVPEGMASSYILSILEDKNGNIWFGTQAGGVSKYDGESFTHFTVKEGLSNNIVYSILEDKSGSIWFGTNKGVSKYDGKSFTHFTQEEGLCNNIVYSVLEDKSGNIWFGTKEGISKYNGNYVDDIINKTNLYPHHPKDLKKTPVKSFTHFTKKEGLSNNYILSILEDKSGNIWIGTWGGGVSKYNGNYVDDIINKTNLYPHHPKDLKKPPVKSFTHFTKKEGLSNNYVYSILEDKNGNIWFGTNKGVTKYNGNCIDDLINETNLYQHNKQDLKKNLLKSFTHFTKKEGLSNNTVYSILEDNNGNIWFGTKGGVSKYNGNCVNDIINDTKIHQQDLVKSFTHYTTKEGLSNNIVRSIIEDENGNIWFGTNGGGVSKYNTKSFTHFTQREGLNNNIVSSILEDKNENIWFGTNHGVSKYDGEFFTHFTTKEGLNNNNIISALEDKNGNIWFGTWGGGVSKYNGNCVDDINNRTNLYQHNQQDLNRNKTDLVKSFTHFTTKEGLSNNYVLSILEDKSGNIWFGTKGGVSKYNGKSFTHITAQEGLIDNTILSIIEDKNGNIWFGSKGGVSKYNGNCVDDILNGTNLYQHNQQDLKNKTDLVKSFTHFTTKEGLSNDNIYSILEDKNGNIWFGSKGGVSKYNGNCVDDILNGTNLYQHSKQNLKKELTKSFTHYTTKEGLSNDYVYSIIEDKNGNIWLSTENGLNNFRPSDNELIQQNLKKIIINTFTKNDGLKGLDFLYNSAFIDSKNRAWWGSGKSLTMLDLNKYSPPINPPTPHLKQININEQIIDYNHITDSLTDDIKFSSVQQFENYPLNLKLSHHQNHLTFHFSAIDWSAPHKIQFSYLMDGLNTNWSQPSNETKADYRNLPYGTYTFKVKAINDSGEWSPSFEYTYTISPPWWHTFWARIGYGIAFLLLILGFTRWRTQKLKRKQAELEIEIEIATSEIRLQKEIVEEAHKEITDSINYAERIQRSFFATEELLTNNLNEYFVFYQPKDVVSGDFYWAGQVNNGNFAMVNADSTGHGVPGAIMSILNISSIEEAIKEGLTAPQEIFNKTRKIIIKRLKKDGSLEGGQDGMDASIICFDFKNKKFTYTAAQSPIWIIRSGNLIEIKPEKMPIGKHENDNISFVGGTFEMEKGDQIYTLTDGYQDQFGGPKNKKFMLKNMKRYILSISQLPMKEQHDNLKETFNNWKGNLTQVDDVCVIGIKIC